jgi:hypothetical protein
MPSEGGIVTPERHSIASIGSEGRALRAEGYLTHFKKRVFSGLGLSAVDFGEGETANRATADSMSRSLVDDVKAMQRDFEMFINEYIIKELLLESTIEDALNRENLVVIKFHEVDLDAKIKVENHMMTLYQGYLTTEDETRRAMGREPLTEEERMNTFWELIKKPEMLIQSIDEKYLPVEVIDNPNMAAGEADITKANEQSTQEQERLAKAKVGNKGPINTKPGGAEKMAKSRNTPSNQHGTNTGPTKAKSFMESLPIQDNVIKLYYNMLRSDTMAAVQQGKYDEIWFKTISLATVTKIQEKLERELRQEFRQGLKKANIDISSTNFDYVYDILRDRAQVYITNIINKLTRLLETKVHPHMAQLKKSEILTKISAIFEAIEFKTGTVYRSELRKAQMFGLALGLKVAGHKSVTIVPGAHACEECFKNKNVTIDLQYVIIEQIPGFHPDCSCDLKPTNINPSESDSRDDLTAKEERCVLQVKQQLRKKFPGRSHEEIKVSAIKICRSAINNESETEKLIQSFNEEDF